MPQSLAHVLIHVVFSTKQRRPYISNEIRSDLHAYLGGIVRELGAKPVTINGTADHVHLLLGLPPVLALADALRVIKTNSSRWVHEKWPERRTFAWQAGYSAFSVSESNAARVIQYIGNQAEHHRKRSFQEELKDFLKKHKIEYDERYVWD